MNTKNETQIEQLSNEPCDCAACDERVRMQVSSEPCDCDACRDRGHDRTQLRETIQTLREEILRQEKDLDRRVTSRNSAAALSLNEAAHAFEREGFKAFDLWEVDSHETGMRAVAAWLRERASRIEAKS